MYENLLAVLLIVLLVQNLQLLEQDFLFVTTVKTKVLQDEHYIHHHLSQAHEPQEQQVLQ